MRRVVKARLNRWAEIGLLSAFGAFVLALFGSSIVKAVDGCIQQIASAGHYVSALSFLSAGILILVGFLYYFLRVRLSHFGHGLKYPPLSSVVVFSFLLAPLWSLPFEIAGGVIEGDWALAFFCSISSAVVWLLYASVFSFFDWYLSPINDDENEAQKVSELEGEPLVRWLYQHAPISDKSRDLFDHTIVADRLGKRLQEKAQSIALLGPYGAGKSSVCKMLEQQSDDIFVTVSCWGVSGSDKIQGILLESILTGLAKHVDCFKLRTLPDHYIKAIGGYSSWLDSLLTLVSHKKTPLDQIERLSPILSAIDKRIVIVIEDLDRNQEGFELSQIQALLVQLKHVKEITFVLAISPEQDIDFLKVCEHLELIDELPRQQTLKIIDQLRSILLRHSNEIILPEALRDITIQEDLLVNSDKSIGYNYSTERCLYRLLSTPRKLRAAMLRLLGAWEDLKGEVNIDELIFMCALRIGAPEAFRYLQRNFSAMNGIRDQPGSSSASEFIKQGSERIKERLLDEWNASVSDADFDTDAAANMICYLSPSFAFVVSRKFIPPAKCQTMAKEGRRSVYAKRLFSESVSKESAYDQLILKGLVGGLTDRKHLARLAELIAHSEEATEAFVEFAEARHFNQHISLTLQLLSEICAVIKSRHGAQYIHWGNPGFTHVWNMLPSGHEDEVNSWIKGEIEACIPRHLNLADALYSAWVKVYSQNTDNRRDIRYLFLRRTKEAWEQADINEISKCFDPSDAYTIHHLVFTIDFEKDDTVPVGEITDWAWLGPILWRGCQERPDVFVPQVLGAVQMKREDVTPDPIYEFDRKTLAILIGDNQTEFLELIANGFEHSEELSQRTRFMFDLAEQQAEMLLKEDEVRGLTGELEGRNV
tara:strand:+ start:1685 stop:4318 length:2634 start_codon:yes stop_codon:yes gene_type:complete